VSPAVAVIVIVIVLALVAVVWLKFTRPVPGAKESTYQLKLENIKPEAAQTPEFKAAAEKAQKAYEENRAKRGRAGK
jgi:hypothetical protein